MIVHIRFHLHDFASTRLQECSCQLQESDSTLTITIYNIQRVSSLRSLTPYTPVLNTTSYCTSLGSTIIIERENVFCRR